MDGERGVSFLLNVGRQTAGRDAPEGLARGPEEVVKVPFRDNNAVKCFELTHRLLAGKTERLELGECREECRRQ